MVIHPLVISLSLMEASTLLLMMVFVVLNSGKVMVQQRGRLSLKMSMDVLPVLVPIV